MTFENFGMDAGVKRTRSFVGENTAGMTDIDESAVVDRAERKAEDPVRLGGLHLAARKSKRDVFSG